jgi:hypothetical protein
VRQADSKQVAFRRCRAVVLVQSATQLALATALVEHRTRSAKCEGPDVRCGRARLLRPEQRARSIEGAIEIAISNHS